MVTGDRLGIFDPGVVYDHLGECLQVLNISALVLCLLLYVKVSSIQAYSMKLTSCMFRLNGLPCRTSDLPYGFRHSALSCNGARRTLSHLCDDPCNV